MEETPTPEVVAPKTALEQLEELQSKSISYRGMPIDVYALGSDVILKVTKNGASSEGILTYADDTWTWSAKPNLQIIAQPLSGAMILFADRL